MDFLQPTSLAGALALRAERPDALPIAGGTDVMVEHQLRPAAARSPARPRPGARAAGVVRGRRAGPARAPACPTPGSSPSWARSCPAWRWPPARSARRRSACAAPSAATSASASPAGDAHPPLLAAGAVVEVASAARGTRRIPAADFYTGVKRNALEPDELIARRADPAGRRAAAVLQDRHPQRHGHRGVGVRLRPAPRPPGGRHRHRLGRAHPAPRPRRRGLPRRRAGRRRALGVPRRAARDPRPRVRRAGRRRAASPIDDVRGSAAYRLHSLSVMARRAVTWAWNDLRKAA